MSHPNTHAVDPSSVWLVTTENVPGREVEVPFGALCGIASQIGRTSANKGYDATQAAMQSLREQAAAWGADAVLSMRISPYAASHGGVLGDAVGAIAYGTAVRLKPIAPSS